MGINVLMALTLIAGGFKLKVAITPPEIILKPGETQKIEVSVFNQRSKQVKPDTVFFKVIPPKLGRVEGDVFHAQEPGIGVLRAIVKKGKLEGVGHAYLEVKRETPLQVIVRPRRAHLEVGERKYFHIEIPDLPPDIKPEITYKVIPEELGTIDSTGLFIANRNGAGRVNVIVKAGDKRGSGSATVIIGRPEDLELRIRIVPPVLFLLPGDTAHLDYMLEGADKKDVVEEWWVEPQRLGRIEDGKFIASAARGRGLLWLTVRKGDKIGIGRALVVVGRSEGPTPKPPYLGVFIEPPYLVMKPGDHRIVMLRVEREFVKRLFKKRRKPPIEWKVKPFRIGSLRTRKGPRAEFTAMEPGLGFIEAAIKLRKRKIKRRIPVLVGERKLTFSPEEAVVHVGDVVKFEILGPPDLVEACELKVFPVKMGEISPDGTFRAEKPGIAYIIAEIPPELGGGGGIAIVHIKPGSPPE